MCSFVLIFCMYGTCSNCKAGFEGQALWRSVEEGIGASARHDVPFHPPLYCHGSLGLSIGMLHTYSYQ